MKMQPMVFVINMNKKPDDDDSSTRPRQPTRIATNLLTNSDECMRQTWHRGKLTPDEVLARASH